MIAHQNVTISHRLLSHLVWMASQVPFDALEADLQQGPALSCGAKYLHPSHYARLMKMSMTPEDRRTLSYDTWKAAANIVAELNNTQPQEGKS